MALALVSCVKQTNINAGIKFKVYYNQALLTDVVSSLRQITGIDINASKEVEAVPDVWVNYSTKEEGEPIAEILNGISKVVRTEHKIDLQIEVLKGENGADTYKIKLRGKVNSDINQ